MVPAAIVSGGMVQKFGWYNPFMIATAVIMPIGAGLLCTFTPTTGHAKWIAYQFLFGFGMGLGMQQPNLAAQATVAKRQVPTAISVLMFFQTLGGAVFASVGQNLLSSRLVKGLASIPDFDSSNVVHIGATELRNVIPAKYLPQVIDVYNVALKDVFYLGAALAACTIFGALTIEWKNLKKSANVTQKAPVEGAKEVAP